MTRTTTRRTVGGSGRALGQDAPLPTSVLDLLARSDAELVAARLGGPSEQFVHAHLAALRAGAALLAVTGRPTGRPVLRTVWEMVASVEPDLAGWTAWFADGAALRAAVESGRAEVDDERAERTLAVAEDFQEAVRRLLSLDGGAQGELALRAS